MSKESQLNQPLRMRRDYDEPTDKETVELKIIPIQDYDEGIQEPLDYDSCPPVPLRFLRGPGRRFRRDNAGPGLLGLGPRRMYAKCMDPNFDAIKKLLSDKKEVTLSESQVKSILNNLDKIYEKYRELEKE